MQIYNFLPLYVYTYKYTHTPFDKGNQAWFLEREFVLTEFPSPKFDSCLHQGSISVTAPSVQWDVQTDEA